MEILYSTDINRLTCYDTLTRSSSYENNETKTVRQFGVFLSGKNEAFSVFLGEDFLSMAKIFGFCGRCIVYKASAVRE